MCSLLATLDSKVLHSLKQVSHQSLKCVQVGGVEEYDICDALKSGRLFKPIIVWCIGTCAKMFTSEVQFGHAGACANAERETADAKNKVGKSYQTFLIRGH